MFQERDTMPTFEPIVTKEQKNKEQEIIALLKENGLDDPEAENLIDEYVTEQEKLGEQSEYSIAGQIQKSIMQARLYAKAGYDEDALRILYSAKENAFHTREESASTLSGKIIDMIEEIEAEETFSEAA